MGHEIFVDCETFSEDATEAAIIDVSAIIIDTNKMLSDKPYTLRDITKVSYFKLNVEHQQDEYDYRISPSTLEFWKKQPKEVRERIKPLKDDIILPDFVKQFRAFVGSEPVIKRAWCRNSGYDYTLLKRMFKSCGEELDELIPFYIHRDIKTAIDTSFNFDPSMDLNFCPIKDQEFFKKVFQPHDSRWDVIADVLRYQAILRINNDKEITDR